VCHIVAHQCHHASIFIFKCNANRNLIELYRIAAQFDTNRWPLKKLTAITLKWNSSTPWFLFTVKLYTLLLGDLAGKGCGLPALCSRKGTVCGFEICFISTWTIQGAFSSFAFSQCNKQFLDVG